jgi:hypothetical protein
MTNTLPIPPHLTLSHDNYKGPQEVILEGVVGQLITLQELHCQLAQTVHSIHGHCQVGVAANSDEVF